MRAAVFDSFELDPRLIKALEALHFEKPTPVQQAMIPQALKGSDMLVSAETGSGKTAAFLLPGLQRMLTTPAPAVGTRMLILSPTRELALQLFKHANQLASFTDIKAGLICGGEAFKTQMALLRKDPEIIIATPGRLLEHVDRNTPDFTNLEFLVLDEADRMLDMGFSEDVLRIAMSCNLERQTLLLSATLKKSGVQRMAREITREPVTLNLTNVEDQAQISQFYVLTDDPKHKALQCQKLLDNQDFEQAIVFTNTRDHAHTLEARLRGHKMALLHGEMEQAERRKIMRYFREKRVKVLISTDLAARGLDIPNIELVINADFPRAADDYVHRIGRTGRAGKTGRAYSLVATTDWDRKASIERYTGQTLEPFVVAGAEAQFKGPKKVKSSGKAAGKKKNKNKPKGKFAAKGKPATKKAAAKKSTAPVENKAAPSKLSTKHVVDGFEAPRRKK